MSGSALPTLGSSTWNRGVIGSVVSGSEEYKGATLLSDYTFKKENPFFRSGEVRYLRLSSGQQSIQDSYVPAILEIYLTGSYGSGSLIGSSEIYFSIDGKEITGSTGQRINNTEWIYSYPFEKKYHEVNNENKQFYTLKFNYLLTYLQANIFDFVSTEYLNLNYNSLNFSQTSVSENGFYKKIITGGDEGGYSDNSGIWTTISTKKQSIDTLNRFSFGINPRYLSISPLPPPRGANSNYFFSSSIGSSCEGWKYGIYNATPTNFSAVFRQNHYGQFRDMLEQRIYTATYNNPQIGGPMDANGGIKFISGSALAGESNNELTASIYNEKPDKLNVAEAYRVNPYGSGIFDTLYRASQPWHDDDTRITVRGGV